MPLSLSGSGGITYPDGTVNATRSVSAAGDTMTGNLTAPNLLRGGSQVFSRNNILGTVSQTSGVPTGAVIERGSNANGEFVRFADGTQICYINGSGWTGSFITKSHTLPANFVNSTIAATWNSQPTTNHHVVACCWSDNATSVSFRHPDTSTQAYYITTHGRWY